MTHARPARPMGRAGIRRGLLALVTALLLALLVAGPWTVRAVAAKPEIAPRVDVAGLHRQLLARLERDPGDRLSRLRLGRILLLLRDPAGASREAGRILAAAPKDREALLLAARAKGLAGDADAAIGLYDRLIEIGPEKGKIADLKLARKVLRDRGSGLTVVEAARQGVLAVDLTYAIAAREREVVTLLHRGPRWVRTFERTTDRFRVRTDGGQAAADQVAGILENSWRVLASVLPPMRGGGIRRTPVFAFRSRTDYVRFLTALVGEGRFVPSTTGAYVREARCVAVLIGRSNLTTLRVLCHEAVHEALDRTVGRPPRWLDEGLAEAGSARLVAATSGPQAPPPARLAALRALVERSGLPRAGQVVGLDDAFQDERRAPEAYALAWAFADFLLVRDASSGSRSVPKLLEAIRDGHPVSTALATAFGPGGLASLDAPFARHVRVLLGQKEGRPR